MSVDLIGNDGTRFSRSWWTWRPVAAYCFSLAPVVCEASHHVHQWQTNDGSMTEAEAHQLSLILKADLDTGGTAQHFADYKIRMESMPDVACLHCKGTGTRHEARDSMGFVRLGTRGKPWTCNACDGEGKVRPPESLYPFDVESVQEFAHFLSHCGGFEVT